ncbi:MAG: hypothetical protein J7530_12360 [Novosphingobium sp.]|nr:hypothetical protein [Novosphingobium sp.]
MALTFTVTTAGRVALINASKTGTAAVTIAQVGVSATAVVPSPAALTLPDESKRIVTISGDVVAADMIHLIVRDESTDVFTVRSFALYLADGTLFAIFGQADPILEKSAQAMMLLAIDVQFADIDAAQLTFGDTNFLNPPATTEIQGVIEIATEEETAAGVDTRRAVVPKALKSTVTKWIDTRFGEGAPSAFVKTLLTAASAAAMRISLGIKGAALKDEGAGNTLDADLLDGQHGAYYADVPARLGYVPWGPNNDGAGSGLDAGLLAGQLPVYYTDISARLGYTPVNKAGDTMTGPLTLPANPVMPLQAAPRQYVDGLVTAAALLAKLLTVDGSGSGVDADLLDGQQGSYYTDILARLGFTPVDKAGDTMTGPLTLSANPTANLHASSKQYVDGLVTASALLAKLLTVDGAGSGLDADLLDGRDSSWFADIIARLGYTPVNRAGDVLSGGLSMPYLSITASGGADNIKLGDDVFIGDGNIANGMAVRGVSDFNAGFIRFGNSPHSLGCNANDGTLRYGANWHVLASMAESMSQNGYMRLSNNLMMVWGRWASSPSAGSPVNISFPASFSTEPYALMLLPVVTASSTISVWSSDGITGSSFPGRCSQASIGCRFFAIGPT